MSFNGYNFSNITTLVDHVGFAKYVLDLNKTISMSSKFHYIKEKCLIKDKNLYQIRIDNVDIYDILNTISVLMSNEIYCNFYKWKLERDNMGMKMTLPIEDYRRLQKGFSTEMMMMRNQYKMSIYRNNPKFPWVLRCMTDLDDLIYSKGIRCMYYVLTSNIHDTQNSYLTIKRWKLLSKLLQHMKGWRSKIIDMNSGFLRGLITFMTPSNMKQTIFVTKTACDIIKSKFGCPIKCPEFEDRFNIKVLKNDQTMMNLYYKWLFTKTPEEALEVFCGVHNGIEYKTSKKRKKSDDRIPRKIDEEILIHYRNIHSQGNPEPRSSVERSLSKNLLDVVYYVFHIGQYTNWNNLPKSALYNTMEIMIDNGVIGKFTPISTLSKTTFQNRCVRQSDIFPIINLPKELKSFMIKNGVIIKMDKIFK